MSSHCLRLTIVLFQFSKWLLNCVHLCSDIILIMFHRKCRALRFDLEHFNMNSWIEWNWLQQQQTSTAESVTKPSLFCLWICGKKANYYLSRAGYHWLTIYIYYMRVLRSHSNFKPEWKRELAIIHRINVGMEIEFSSNNTNPIVVVKCAIWSI